MKYLLVIVVVAVVLWLMLGSRRRDEVRRSRHKPGTGPVPVLECAHCGVHLPRTEALMDAAGRPYCSEAHRLAGRR